MTWSSVWSPRGKFILHVCHDSLTRQLSKELTERFGEITVNPATRMHIDRPGMVWMRARSQEIVLDLLSIRFPVNDFNELLSIFSRWPKRQFADGSEYYKLHNGYGRCLVCTPEQRDLLLDEMRRLSSVVEKMAEDDCAEQLKQLEQHKRRVSGNAT